MLNSGYIPAIRRKDPILDMQNENTKNPLALINLPITTTHCDGCEEESMCNCENNERITPYFSDDGKRSAELYGPKCSIGKDATCAPCEKIKQTCQSIGKRLQKDWEATNGKPYIKQTSTLRFDVYRSCDDEEPIDSFCTESVKAYSLKALALVGLGAAVLACTAKCILKKLWK